MKMKIKHNTRHTVIEYRIKSDKILQFMVLFTFVYVSF